MTTNGPNGSGTDSERADPASVAARIGGEAPASPPRGKGRAWTEEQKRAASERMKQSHAEGTAPKGRGQKKAAAPDMGPITPEEEQMTGMLIGSMWNSVGGFVKLAPLDDKDQIVIGKAAVPVIRKYLPMVGDWAIEINFVMVVAMLVQAKRAQWKADHPESDAMELNLSGLPAVPAAT